jgi:hypothetical protein
MNNLPIHRFRAELERENRLEGYTDRLVSAFNPKTIDGLMCRRTISVGWDGRLHDCDFNQALGIPLGDGMPSHISDFDIELLRMRPINTKSHCFGCAAGAGSSCNGALVQDGTRSRAETLYVQGSCGA